METPYFSLLRDKYRVNCMYYLRPPPPPREPPPPDLPPPKPPEPEEREGDIVGVLLTGALFRGVLKLLLLRFILLFRLELLLNVLRAGLVLLLLN